MTDAPDQRCENCCHFAENAGMGWCWHWTRKQDDRNATCEEWKQSAGDSRPEQG